MQRISSAGEQVRNLTNQNGMYEKIFASKGDDWNRLCVAMDMLGDSADALMNYESYGLGSSVEERYIRLYGTLQAIILQQDAIKSIYEIYLKTKPDIKPCSAWQQCRKLRNLAIGHPLDAYGNAKEGKLRVFLSRATITECGFDLLICQENNPDQLVSKRIDFKTPYNAYKKEALEFLKMIEEKQKNLIATL